MNDKYYLPQTLDEPFRVFLLTLDELIVLLAPIFFVGFIMGSMVIGFMLGIVCLLAVKKVKGEQGHYFVIHLLYWHLPEIIRYRATPPSSVRELLG